MSAYLEAFKAMAIQNDVIKSQRDELLKAAKDIIRATKWLKDERHELAYTRLKAVIEKVEDQGETSHASYS